jgi:hypothetical protein
MAENTPVTKPVAKERTRRTPINGQRSVLGVKGKDPAYEYRIVNDVNDRISEFEERGYEIVSDSGVTVGDKRVGKVAATGSPVEISVGQGTKAYLMRIKKEWYAEDQKAKANHINAIEADIKAETRKDGNYGSIDIK